MARAFQPRLSGRGNLRRAGLLVGFMASWTLLIVTTQAETDAPAGSGESAPVRVVAAVVGSAAVSSSSPPTNSEPLVQEDQPRPSRSVKPRRFSSTVRGSGSDAWYWEMGASLRWCWHSAAVWWPRPGGSRLKVEQGICK